MTVINEIKEKVDIVEVVSDYVPLQKAGRNFKGLCPFHNEKHPSFFVFPEQQTWHCFGACGSGGDVFSFIMKKEGIEFSQALKLLAQRSGITLSSSKISDRHEDEEKEKSFRINEAAAEYYHHLLLNTKAGEAARSYLSKRKITPEITKEFRLGFSPDSWETIKRYLISKGYEERELAEAGLIVEKDGSSYDRFRNRLMFPICDIQGQVIGFGARALDDSLPKYINSPQTSTFDKGGSLYGIDKAKDAIRRENSVIIVEGYMDVLVAHEHGWRNVVASMGTSLTEKQVDIAKRLTRNMALALDADAAGEEATLRGAELLAHSLGKKATSVLSWSEELARSVDKGVAPSPSLARLVEYQSALDAEIKVILLPSGKDPDEVIKDNPAGWQDLVKEALPVLDFAFQATVSKIDINKAKDKSLALQKLLPLVCEMAELIQQDHYVRKLAKALKVREFAITTALGKLQLNKRRQQSIKPVDQSRFAYQLLSSPIEEYCLALLVQYPELRQIAQGLSADHLEYTENRELFTRWQRSSDIPTLKDKVDANLQEHLNYLLSKNFPQAIREDEKVRRSALTQCILRLQEKSLKNLEARREQALILENEAGGSRRALAKLEEQGIESTKELKEIFIKQADHWRKREAE